MRTQSIALLLAAGGLALAGCGPKAANVAAASSAMASAAPAPAPAPESAAPAPETAADVLPTAVGQCAQTTVKEVSTRLEDTPGSGSAISYSNGGGQVSYDQVPGIDHSQAGDPIKLCLVSLPQDCPPGDDRGKTYAATNQRTGETWTEADSEHSCGGA